MGQNVNCCSSDWIERTKYTQGRCGSKPENIPLFIYHHESLLKSNNNCIWNILKKHKFPPKNNVLVFKSALYLIVVMSKNFLPSYLELWHDDTTCWRKSNYMKVCTYCDKELRMKIN